MKSFFKLIAMLLVITAVFFAGYFTGSFRAEKLNRLLASARSEMATKVTGLEGEIRTLRFRMRLTTARDRLLTAESNIQERNFGSAEKDLKSAKEELHAAAQLASKENGEALIGLEGSIDGVIENVHRSDLRAKSKLDAVKADLDQLINRS